MHITLYHDAVVPPKKYGGTERVVYWLGKALVALGEKVTLIAQEGSEIPGAEFISLGSGSAKSWIDLVPSSTDVVHLWAPPQDLPKKPCLITIGGNGQIGEKFHPNTVFVSKNHAENHGSSCFVHNGIDPDDYVCNSNRENYAVFLAKAAWKVKNLKGAIEIARRASVPLKVLGSRNWPLQTQRVFSEILSSFCKTVPFYYGMVDDFEKRKILSRAKVLLFPVRWNEPFGLALTESLASGCGVLGTPYGSLPEIISNSQIGVLSAHADDLIKGLQKTFDPKTCRKHVFEGFTHLQMAESYRKYYNQVLTLKPLNATPPQWRYPTPPQDLLPFN